ncbi:MAG TPA: ABC transporter permease [Geminicoccus sp.]|uniref:ABC transporter permease n=1 Tax=Geminicoccus sp. TaxID=2024832 RepID=UPI002C96B995|nr:ABC transporter permease [Geminicoccus sp.]HWL70982.1 ABC transporter permease [Geminicoccus sp.]
MSLRLLPVFVRALVRSLPTVAIIVVFNFFLLNMAPGDAADVLAAESGAATAETMAATRARLGLDLPLLDQFLNYVTGLLHLDLGFSAKFGVPVLEVILDRLPNTLLLMVTALVFALLVGIIAGFLMALRAGSILDRAISVVALFFYSVPSFWGALMLIVIFSVQLGWLPSSGYQTIGFEGSGLELALDMARYLALPALSLSLFFIAIYARLTRASMLEVYGQDYVRTAVAKGLPPSRIALRHVLRNALVPVTTVAGIHFGILLGGAIVTETVFAWPGLGSLAFQAVFARDFAVLLGILLLSSVLVIVINIATDLLHAWLDPRVEVS